MVSTPKGSSPLARGTPVMHTPHEVQNGLIPARAGNTSGIRIGAEHLGAHPRSRGEHRTKSSVGGAWRGSSPLARGTQAHGHLPVTAPVAHPRSRGEHGLISVAFDAPVGSSPLARGTQSAAPSLSIRLGLIPARAGNTPPSTESGAPFRAHPRSRGEHSNGVGVGSSCAGSSPLARGTQCSTASHLKA